jgi:hypothetical protein
MSEYIDINPARPITRVEGETEWSDYGKAAVSAVEGVGASLAEGASYLRGKVGDELSREQFAIEGRQARQASEDTIESMTPAARQSVRSNVLSEDFWEAPGRAVGLKLTGAAVSTAVSAIPAALVAAVAGPVAGVGTAMAIGAGQGLGEFLNDVSENIDRLDDASLKKQSSLYAGLRTRMPEEQARLEFRDWMVEGEGRNYWTAIYGALAAGAGVEGMAARLAGGKAATALADGRGLAGRVGVAGAQEGLTEGAQGGASNKEKQDALIDGGLQKEFDYREFGAQVLEGLGLGALMGGPMGVPKGRQPKETGVSSSVIAPEHQVALDALNPAPQPQPIPEPVVPTPAQPTQLPPADGQPAAPPAAPAGVAPPATIPDRLSPVAGGVPAPTPEQVATSTEQAQTVPEPPATVDAQLTDLTDGVRKAVLLPEKAKIKVTPGMERMTIPKVGRIEYNPELITPTELRDAARRGRLNEVLNMGDTSKVDVAEAVSQGAQPVAVVVRNEEGVPTVEAASSTASVEEDAAKMAEQARPTDTVEVTTPEAVLQERVEAQATPEVTQRVTSEDFVNPQPNTPRVLKDVSEEGKRADKAAAEAEARRQLDLLNEEIAKMEKVKKEERAEQVDGKVGVKAVLTKDTTRLAEMDRHERAAQKIVSENQMGETDLADLASSVPATRNAAIQRIHQRAVAMVDAARAIDEKIIPQRARKAGNERLLLREAVDLLKRVGKLKGPPSPDAFRDFAMKEAAFRKGGDTAMEARAERKAEAKAKVAEANVDADELPNRTQIDLADRNTPEDALLAKEEENEVESDEPTPEARDREPVKKGGFLAAGEFTGKVDARGNPVFESKKAAVVETSKRRKLADVKPTGKITLTSKPKVLASRKRDFDRLTEVMTDDEALAALDELARSIGSPESTMRGPTISFAGTNIAYMEVTNGRDLLKKLSGSIDATGANRVAMDFFRRKLMNRVGDVPVYFVTDEEMSTITARHGFAGADGLYDPTTHAVALNADILRDPNYNHDLVVHELTHAWAHSIIDQDADVRDVLTILTQHARRVADANGMKSPYGLTNAHEFISEVFGNQNFRDFLASVPLSTEMKGILDNLLGAEHSTIRTLWEAFVSLLRKAMRLNSNEYTALDAALRISQAIDQRSVTGNYSKSNGPRTPQARIRDDVTDRMAASAAFGKRNAIKFMTGDQMRQQFADTVIGQGLAKIWNSMARVNPLMRDIRKKSDELAQKYIDFQKRDPKMAEQFADLALEARALDVSLGATSANANKHIGKGAKHWQARANLAALEARWQQLSPEAKSIWKEMTAYYRDEHNAVIRASVKSLLEDLGLKGKLTDQQVTDITARVMNGTLNQQAAHVIAYQKNLLGPTAYKALQTAREFRAVKGDYFPEMRYGDHVVRTEDKITDTKGGVLVEPDTVEFRNASDAVSRRMAETFVKSSDLHHLTTQSFYYDLATGKEMTRDEADAIGAPPSGYGYRVTMQTQGTYFFESRAEAEKFVRTNPEGHDVVRPAEDRMGEGYSAQTFSGSQVSSLVKSVEAREGLSSAHKQLLKAVIHNAAVRSLRGNRIASRRLKSRHVTGASKDMARNLLQYGEASARHRATAETMPVVRDGLREMDKALENYEGNDRPSLIAVREEVKKRVDQGIIEPNEPGKFIKDVLALSFLARLASPMYSVINGLQVGMVTLPYLGGKYGNARAAAAISKAYGQVGLGESVLAGLGNTVRATKQFTNAGLLGTDDVVGNIRKKLAGDKDLLAAYDRAIEVGAIDPSAGLEINASHADGRGVWGKGLAGADRIARQLPQVVEAVNRSVSLISAYNLAREAKMSPDKAMQFAIDTVKNTQGDYSSNNAPRFFNHPWLRPAMQFRKYAQMITYLLGDMANRAWNGATPEERRIAYKQLMNVVAVQIAMAGALSLPGIELIKVAFMLGAALGLSDGWDEQEEKLRKVVDATVGREFGQMVTNGVFTRLGGYGIDVSQRLSLSDIWLFGEPRKNDADGWAAYAFRLIGGSAGSYVVDTSQGMREIVKGDVDKGLGKVVPIKMVADLSKAIDRYREGNQSGAEIAVNTFGAQTASQAERMREVIDRKRRSEKREEQRKELSRAFYGAKTRAEQIRAVAKNREWNKNLGPSEWRLRLPTTLKVAN